MDQDKDKSLIQGQNPLQDYKYGFVTDVEMDTVPKGLNEDVIALISSKKAEPSFMLELRLKAYRHWLTMKEPHWANFHYEPIDYQDLRYYAAPKKKTDGYKSMDEVDQEVVKTFEKLGIP
ncbi:MAG: Fe-S cluster assembly protein SufB, partial [Candidatus Omnitrophota bacterium]